jgi:DNA-binding CsgD family transcriptional regulator
VKALRNFLTNPATLRESRKTSSLKPTCFIFCDRKTGAARFRIEAGPDGQLPLEHASSLLAIYCLAHHRSPEDFILTFTAAEDQIRKITARAAELLSAAGIYAKPTDLSRREQQVLEGVAQNLSNKEIACRLGVSERTIKFHVSSLLQKLGARGRVELARFCSENSLPPAWMRPNPAFADPDSRNTPREEPAKQLAAPAKKQRIIRVPEDVAFAVN